jgi:hypothetical protein
MMMKKKLINVAAGLGIAGAMGVAALGIGAATANAAPPSPGSSVEFARWGHGWDPRPGPWGPPPPPAWGYGYGDYGYAPPPPPCVSGPLGFVSLCA